MSKKMYVLPFFAIVLASCNFQEPLPSLSSLPSSSVANSSITSQMTSSSVSSSSSLSSVSSVTSSSASSASSSISSSSVSSSSMNSTSSSSSSSTSSSSSQTAPQGRKVPFNQISSLVAQVADAKALGVANSKDAVQVSGRRATASPTPQQNYLVKVTETYNPVTNVTEDNTLQVSFTRVTTTVTNELQTGFETYVAEADDIVIEKTTDLPGHVVVTNVPNYQFRALQGEAVLTDWKRDVGASTEFLFTTLQEGNFTEVAVAPDVTIVKTLEEPGRVIIDNIDDYEFRLLDGTTVLQNWIRSEDPSIEFVYDINIPEVTIEARSYNASITFNSLAGLTYQVSFAGTSVAGNVTDGGVLDVSSTANEIKVVGLTEGLTYDVAFSGQVADATKTNITIEARSTDASVTFTAVQDFTYVIKSGSTTLFSNITDNGLLDLDLKTGVIRVKGLTEGLPYDVHYSGYRLVERITQDDIDGQVDKLYVLYQYTFISFVPLNLNQRPKDDELIRDYDRVAVYDKTNYFSSSTRQSFVIDNDSGYIYRIEGITIANLSGGCVRLAGNAFPFDMVVNGDSSLTFRAINENPALVYNTCIKDKHGYTYINNNLINSYESSTKTYYYVPNSLYSTFYDVPFNNAAGTGQSITYWLNSQGEAVRTERTQLAHGGLIYRVMTGASVNDHRPLNALDNFELYVSQFKYGNIYSASTLEQVTIQGLVPKTMVREGTVYTYFGPNNTGKVNPITFASSYSYYNQFNYVVKTVDNTITYYSSFIDPNHGLQAANYATNIEYLEAHGIVMIYRNNRVFYYSNYWDNHMASFASSNNPNILTSSFNNPHGGVLYGRHTTAHVGTPIELTELAGATLDGQGKLNKITATQNVSYDLIAEEVNGVMVIKPYVTGTYTAPATTSITFQPINK